MPPKTSTCCSSESASSDRGSCSFSPPSNVCGEDESRVQKAGHHRDAGDVDGGRRREPISAAPMRLRQKSEERRDCAEQRKNGMPSEPRDVVRKQNRVGRPADEAHRRHHQPERDGRPEQPLATAPDVPSPHDHGDAGRRRHQQREQPEPGQHVRISLEEIPDADVENAVNRAAQEPRHVCFVGSERSILQVRGPVWTCSSCRYI